MQIMLDLKDEKEDRQEGLLTLPALLGKEKTLKLLKPVILLVSFLLPLMFGLIISKVFFVLFLLVFLDLISVYLVKKNNYLGYLLQAGQFLFWLILLLIVKIR